MSEQDMTPAQVASLEYEGFLASDGLDSAWIAGWHSAVNHVTAVLAREFPATPPPPTEPAAGVAGTREGLL